MNTKSTYQLPADYLICKQHSQPIGPRGLCPDCEQAIDRELSIQRSDIDYEGWSEEAVESTDENDNLYDNPLSP